MLVEGRWCGAEGGGAWSLALPPSLLNYFSRARNEERWSGNGAAASRPLSASCSTLSPPLPPPPPFSSPIHRDASRCVVVRRAAGQLAPPPPSPSSSLISRLLTPHKGWRGAGRGPGGASPAHPPPSATCQRLCLPSHAKPSYTLQYRTTEKGDRFEMAWGLCWSKVGRRR